MRTRDFKEMVSALDEDTHPFIRLINESVDTESGRIIISIDANGGDLNIKVPDHMLEVRK